MLACASDAGDTSTSVASNATASESSGGDASSDDGGASTGASASDTASDSSGGSDSGGVDPFACQSGTYWTMGDEESPNMHPGRDCISCHATEQEEEAPQLLVAGTVFSAVHEPDDCNGVGGGLLIELTGADGQVFMIPTQSPSGNFYAEIGEIDLMLPYKAAVIDVDKRRDMVATQSVTNCAACHTQNGLSMAPGRIIAP